MWLFTRHGMFSVVCDDGRPLDGRTTSCRKAKSVNVDRMMIRARVREHLVALKRAFPALLRDFEVVDTPSRDYACRLIVPRATWAKLGEKLATDIDYGNFKQEVGHDRVDGYDRMLPRIWSLGFSLQQEQKHRRPTKKAQAEAIRVLIDDYARMSDAEFATSINELLEIDGNGVSTLSTPEWTALRARGWAVTEGTGIHTVHSLTETGRARLGI